MGECSWSAQERTDSTLLLPAETSVGSRVGYKKSLSLLAETIFRCDNICVEKALITRSWSLHPSEGLLEMQLTRSGGCRLDLMYT
jgi:hypothetical protein